MVHRSSSSSITHRGGLPIRRNGSRIGKVEAPYFMAIDTSDDQGGSPDRSTNDRQDKDAGPAPFRSVSTPRGRKHLASRTRVYGRKAAVLTERRLDQLADLLCADLARDAWQADQVTLETAGVSARALRRHDTLAELL